MKYLLMLVAVGMSGCSNTPKPPEPAPPLEAKVTAKPPADSPKFVPEPGVEQQMSCSRGKESRMLEVLRKDAGCTLNYSKGGKYVAVASSAVGTKHCEQSKDKIRAKLEKAGFACKAI